MARRENKNLLPENINTLEKEEKLEIFFTAFKKGIKSLEKRIKKIEISIEEARRFPSVRKEGELLKTNFNSLSKGMKEIELEDFFHESLPKVKISLNSFKTPAENIDDKFQLARKLENSIPFEEERILGTKAEIDELRLRLLEFEEKEDFEWGFKQLKKYRILKFLSTENQPSIPTKKLDSVAKMRAKIKKFYSKDGYWIFVGGDSAENEFVSFRIGSGKDLWLHVDGRPGSHVVIKLNSKGDIIPNTTIKEAAALAIHYSKLRGGKRIPITLTNACHIKKVKGAPQGTVHAHFNKGIKGDDSEEILKPLMERTRDKIAE